MGLIPLSDVPHQRKSYGGIGQLRPMLYGRVYAPDGPYSQALYEPKDVVDGYSQMDEDNAGDDGDVPRREVDEKRVAKNQRLWRKWNEEIIPMLLKPYNELLQQTSGLRNLQIPHSLQGCHGCANGRLLSVTCVFFERAYEIVSSDCIFKKQII